MTGFALWEITEYRRKCFYGNNWLGKLEGDILLNVCGALTLCTHDQFWTTLYYSHVSECCYVLVFSILILEVLDSGLGSATGYGNGNLLCFCSSPFTEMLEQCRFPHAFPFIINLSQALRLVAGLSPQKHEFDPMWDLWWANWHRKRQVYLGVYLGLSSY